MPPETIDGPSWRDVGSYHCHVGYLLIALVLTAVGSFVLIYRYRKPRSQWAVEEFQREMRALAPDERRTGRDRAP